MIDFLLFSIFASGAAFGAVGGVIFATKRADVLIRNGKICVNGAEYVCTPAPIEDFEQ